MIKKYISIFFLLHFAMGSIAQMAVSELSKKAHVYQLKAGVLLVTLPNSDKKIEILKANGQYKAAEKEEKEIKKIREMLIDGFNKDWDFSEVLFFEAENATEVFKKDFTLILDRDLKPLKELPLFEHFYSVRYGPGNPAGEFYRYNGNGLQIRYLANGELQTIKSNLFFNGEHGENIIADFFRRIFKRKKAKKAKLGLVGYLNFKIKNFDR